jgi:RNA polymerase sigma factor (sigma-70 family)
LKFASSGNVVPVALDNSGWKSYFSEICGNPGAPATNIQLVTDDAELIAASIKEPRLFGAVFDRHFEAVFAFCARRVGRDVAEDLAGETFRLAFEGRGGYDPARLIARPWLLGIARNLIRNDRRRRIREAVAYRRSPILRACDGPDFAHQATESLDAAEDLSRIRRGLWTMTDEELEPLLLHVWEGLSYEEVAQVMGIAVGTVRSRIHRVRTKLAATLAVRPLSAPPIGQ